MENVRLSERSGTLILGIVLAGLIALAAFAAPSAKAEDSPFRIDFDQNQVKIGLIPEIPVGATSPGGSIEGTVDENGNVTVPPEGFVFPVYGISDPIKVEAYMTMNSNATGTWDEETGALTLNGKVGIFAKINIGETLAALEGFGVDIGDQLGPLAGLLQGDLACGFSPMDVTFTTEGTPNTRFSKGTLGPGAVKAEWGQLGKFAGQQGVSLSSFACPLIKSYAPTLLEGAIGGSLPDGLDLGGLDLASILDNLDSLNLGPSSLTMTRTLDENVPVEEPGETTSPELRLSVNPKQRKVKAGKKAVFTVKVKNVGDGAANGVKVCIKSPGPKVLKGKRCRTLGKVMAGATQTRRFTVKVKKGAKKKYRVGFEVRASNATRSGSATRLLVRR